MTKEDAKFLESVPVPRSGQRTCAVCLAAVDRNDYNFHMADHGYVIIDLKNMWSETDTSGVQDGQGR